MAMETISEALARLTAAGYADEYRAEANGLRSSRTGEILPPDRFRVDEIVRFEGESDPSEESAIFALTANAGDGKGTYTIAYGPLMDALDADMVRRLPRAV